ncbi:MAG: YkgJ family cysteine cluster protein [Candidatus Latescibacterota bacterium]|jgi:Fe-S-cluster containining protein
MARHPNRKLMPNTFQRVRRQTFGKIRRFFLLRFQENYVEKQMESRQGECNQCGNCCEILFRCPFLVKVEDGSSLCSIYENRPKQCAAFPIDEKCLSEVDFDCTYTFDNTQKIVQIEPALHQAD